MGYKIVGVFELPSSDSNADAEDAFWKTVGTGDIKELKERKRMMKVAALVMSPKHRSKDSFSGQCLVGCGLSEKGGT